jgi:predicted aspartyl protease
VDSATTCWRRGEKQLQNRVTKQLAFLVALITVALVTTAGAAAAAGSKCKLVQIEEWSVRLAHNLLLIDGAINDEKIEILLDTGSTSTLIFRAAAKRLHLDTRSARGVMFGVGGDSKVEIAEPNQIRIGQVSHKGWPMLVAGENDPGGKIALILGEDFFQQADVEFDLAHNAVRLFQALDCDGVSLVYWTSGDAGEVEIERISEAKPQIVLPVKINGQSLEALLDCGTATSVLSKAAAARLGVTPETPGVIAVGSVIGVGRKSVPVYSAPLQSFAIGNETIRDTTISFGDIGTDASRVMDGSSIRYRVGTPTGMLLGVDFLKAHRVLVAHSQRKIYFTYVGGPVFERAQAPLDGKQ